MTWKCHIHTNLWCITSGLNCLLIQNWLSSWLSYVHFHEMVWQLLPDINESSWTTQMAFPISTRWALISHVNFCETVMSGKIRFIDIMSCWSPPKKGLSAAWKTQWLVTTLSLGWNYSISACKKHLPTTPVPPVLPWRPATPGCPWGPVDPVSPVNPWLPVPPLMPCDLVDPVKPVGPVWPIKQNIIIIIF